MTAPLYVPGRRINCSADEIALEYHSRGWYQSEADRTWVEGLEGRLSFSIRRPLNSYVLVAEVSPFLPAGLQTLEVFFNYFRVDFFEITQQMEIAIELPAELFLLRSCVVGFHCAEAKTGYESGVDDGRRLGVAFHSWMLS